MSIRARLRRLLLLSIVPLVLVIGVGLYMFVRASLLARFDDGLLARARALSATVRSDAGRVEFDFAGEAMPQYQKRGGDEFFELWSLRGGALGDVVERSGSLGEFELSARLPGDSPVAWDAPLPGGRAGRLVALAFAAHPEHEGEYEAASEASEAGPAQAADVLLVVAQSRRELDRTLGLFASALGGAGVMIVGGLLLAVRLALKRGLASIDKLAAQVETIGPGDPKARLDSAGAPRELAPIAQRTNAMLDRLAAALEHEKRLAASAAHELRTPIAEIRAVSELALSRGRSPVEYQRALATVLAAAERMSDSADAVLRLARVQSGRERLSMIPIDLREALLPAWSRWIAPLESRGVRVELQVAPEIRVRGDRAMLDVIFDNLCSNMAESAPEGGQARIECRSEVDHRVAIRFTNSTSGRDHDLAAVQNGSPGAPGSRGSQPSLHAGLGLSIAGSMAAACGGALEVHEGDDRFAVVVSLAGEDGPVVPVMPSRSESRAPVAR